MQRLQGKLSAKPEVQGKLLEQWKAACRYRVGTKHTLYGVHLMCLLVLGIGLAMLSGCASTRLIDKIPYASFDKFSYHRGGNVTSADIQATGASFDGKVMAIQSLSIKEDWGPAASLSIYIEGLRRYVSEPIPK